MKEDVMVIPLRVPRELGRSWKMEAVKQDKSVQRWIIEQMGRTILVHTNRRERSSVASSSKSGVTRRAAMEDKADEPARPVQQTGDAIKGGSTPSTPAIPTEAELVTPMAKCRKCGDSFPVADMVTEPKTGKLFCPDCVENMRNNQ